MVVDPGDTGTDNVSDSRFRIFRFVCAGAGLLGLLAAVLLMVLPLPPQDVGVLAGPLYCGPGASSDSPLEVMLHPEVVNEGDRQKEPAQDTEEAQRARQDRETQNSQVCLSAAKPRFIWAGVAILMAVAIGLAAPSILRPRRPA
ncbi:hypothetical protein ACGFMK_18000 [Amycolatopsis sp. NPDC049252]|uniref:hypothetical protein n=1 Tax=Amycolatopsis sp. NPDC049252 TaxID=3363933 RepID=UPI003715C1D9